MHVCFLAIWLTALETLLQAQRVLRKTLKKAKQIAEETANQPGLDEEDPDKQYKEELAEDEDEEKPRKKKGRGRGRGKGKGRGGRGKSKGKGKQEQQQPDGENEQAQTVSNLPEALATQLTNEAAAVAVSDKKEPAKKAKARSKKPNCQEQQPTPESTTSQSQAPKRTRDDQEPKEAPPKAKRGRKSGELPLDCPEAQRLCKI